MLVSAPAYKICVLRSFFVEVAQNSCKHLVSASPGTISALYGIL